MKIIPMSARESKAWKALLVTISTGVLYIFGSVIIKVNTITHFTNATLQVILATVSVAAVLIHSISYYWNDRFRLTEELNSSQVNQAQRLALRWAVDVFIWSVISYMLLLMNPAITHDLKKNFYHAIVGVLLLSLLVKYGCEIIYYRQISNQRFSGSRVSPVSEPQTFSFLSHFTSIKRIAVTPLVFIIVVTVFLLLKPIFVWQLGWRKLPELNDIPLNSGVYLSKSFSTQQAGNFTAVFEQAIVGLQNNIKAPAVSAAVAIDGHLAWAGARGYRDINHKIPADVRTRFRTGSVAKPITAVGVATLVAKGVLDIDKSIYGYGIAYRDPDMPITTRQLLSHTAGVRDYQLCWCFPIWEYYNNDTYHSVRDAVAITQKDELLFKPGDNFLYSTYGYNLVALIVESRSAMNYLDFMEQAVFDPLNMSHTSPENSTYIADNVTRFYETDNGQIKEAIYVDNSNKWAGGGFLSTPSDLVRLGVGVLDGSYLPSHVKNIFFTPQNLSSGETNKQNYGLGFRIDQNKHTEQSKSTLLIHHGGTAVGGTAFLLIRPIDRIVIAIMTNVGLESSSVLGDMAKNMLESIDAERRASREYIKR